MEFAMIEITYEISNFRNLEKFSLLKKIYLSYKVLPQKNLCCVLYAQTFIWLKIADQKFEIYFFFYFQLAKKMIRIKFIRFTKRFFYRSKILFKKSFFLKLL